MICYYLLNDAATVFRRSCIFATAAAAGIMVGDGNGQWPTAKNLNRKVIRNVEEIEMFEEAEKRETLKNINFGHWAQL